MKKKDEKLVLQKVTLRNLDDDKLLDIAAGHKYTLECVPTIVEILLRTLG
jgi:hypothetical protein